MFRHVPLGSLKVFRRACLPSKTRAAFLSLSMTSPVNTGSSVSWKPNTYPPAARGDHVDVYKSEKDGDVRIPDPYRWLEVDSPQTDEWTTAQEQYTNAYLEQLPHRQQLTDEIRANTNFPKFSPPVLHGSRWYWSYNAGLQAQPVIYRSKDAILPEFSNHDGGPGGEVFFDPNVLTSDGTASLATSAFSEDGKLWAYAISLSGSDTATIYVRSADSPMDVSKPDMPAGGYGRLDEELSFVKFSSVEWTHDSKGFFYQRFPERTAKKDENGGASGTIDTEKDENAMLCYHKIGTKQSDDLIVYQDPANPHWMFYAGITELDGRYLFLYQTKDTSRKNLLWVTDLESNEIGPNMKWTRLIDEWDAQYHVIGNDGPLLYIQTNAQAPQQKVMTLDLTDEKLERKELIPEDPKAHLESVDVVKDKLVVVYKRNVMDEIYLYSKRGERLERVAEDFVGSAYVTSKQDQSFFFVSMSGFTMPGIIGKYDLDASNWAIYRSKLLKGLNPLDFESQQVWFSSKDGTRVPMFIVRHKSTPLDGTAPAIQYGYGGFSISINPSFSSTILTLCQKFGFVYASVNIRGGNEFGEEWHLAGTKERKANCFDDFIYATKHLVENKFAAPGKVAINGGSNGGLLIAACVNRAPELFGCAVADVGVMDYLKFNKFTIGHAWVSDYGNPDDPHDFDFMAPLSPLHNVPKDKTLPPYLMLTADHDDRVVPLHSFKLTATLQHTLPNNANPILLRVDKKAGHGGGKSTEKRIVESGDKWSFVAHCLGAKWRD
ncbi:prolyl oligopeptidase [Flagelloscypha sp. PMI_526]|nr:prolyl oligopeptidase [Flagelloscypha sp. PMI_526]